MSLTTDDLQQIRNIVEDTVHPLQNEIAALRNDVKEIYDRLTRLEQRMTNLDKRMTNLENKIIPDKQFEKLTLEQKILKLNSELLVAAKQAGVTLPR